MQIIKFKKKLIGLAKNIWLIDGRFATNEYRITSSVFIYANSKSICFCDGGQDEMLFI